MLIMFCFSIILLFLTKTLSCQEHKMKIEGTIKISDRVVDFIQNMLDNIASSKNNLKTSEGTSASNKNNEPGNVQWERIIDFLSSLYGMKQSATEKPKKDVLEINVTSKKIKGMPPRNTMIFVNNTHYLKFENGEPVVLDKRGMSLLDEIVLSKKNNVHMYGSHHDKLRNKRPLNNINV